MNKWNSIDVQMRLICKIKEGVDFNLNSHECLNILHTFVFRLYFVMLTNGTSPNVRAIAKTIPPIRPAKFSCQGIELIPNKHANISKSLINAK